MVAYKLKLNDSKTEFIILGAPVQLTKVISNSIKVGDDSIASCDQVRNLGVIFDKHMKMDKHIMYLIQRLQSLQNSAARLVADCYDFDTPSLSIIQSVHWLPVEFRIKFKVLIIVYKCIHGMAPSYLSDDVTFQVNTRYTLRSSNTLTLTDPRTNLKTCGDRAFPSAGPKLWNRLPISITQFKSLLKSHFFKLVFR
ncbi:hypothetical protein HOLleu_29037 [Holothuria leucospilota]|uniref:Reverse transcriptase domain-containing protein n=1 Tax=Holothuria leucospilota TaxID=206669 RepID=A0A9Q1BN75_HOLLE|nr:hypothetical protein HOLleu_29037 [Holothuria leucospilota]